jgi:hypothetical protein
MDTKPLYRFIRMLLLIFTLGAASSAAMAENRSDIWWNPAEAGRGLVVIDHETNLFMVWCTYLPNGLAVWYAIPGGTLSADGRVFEGAYYRTASVGYGEVQAASLTRMGLVRIDFGPEDLPQGTARYTLMPTSGSVEVHELTRQSFGTGSPQWGTDATDLWIDRENDGWGVATIQHGADIFGVVFTYEYSGNPTWFVAPAQRAAGTSQFDGLLYATKASAGSFDPGQVQVSNAGFATMRFFGTTNDPRPSIMQFDMAAAWVPTPNMVRLFFGRERP